MHRYRANIMPAQRITPKAPGRSIVTARLQDSVALRCMPFDFRLSQCNRVVGSPPFVSRRVERAPLALNAQLTHAREQSPQLRVALRVTHRTGALHSAFSIERVSCTAQCSS
ncbi:hypothetical protein BX592_103376 [Paraburkholderia rhizosphaerae]|uniref:Uncharacterized protein n=1 Tax=Paraburkholderia rhizosphaerae TaxID=480658 RepID=A0A4R8LYT8_9BURK|nr:hypothetical protein BX592_103376 [Paraburkholderia rhizosphaerae]